MEHTAYLSKRNTDCLKGILAVLVLIHHLTQNSGLLMDTPLRGVFANLGYLSVSAFLFLSGYGMMASYNKKGKKYAEQLPLKRMLPFYCIIIILIVMHAIEKSLGGSVPTFEELAVSLFPLGGGYCCRRWLVFKNANADVSAVFCKYCPGVLQKIMAEDTGFSCSDYALYTCVCKTSFICGDSILARGMLLQLQRIF